MTEQLTITIPSSTTCRYIITTDQNIDHPEEFTIDLLAADSTATGRQTAELMRQAIGTSQVRIRSHPADDSPCQAELAYIAAPTDGNERSLTATRHIVIDSTTSPAQQPHQARAIRATARALADALSGQLADPITAQLTRPLPGTTAERDWFCPADDWLGIDCRINPDTDINTTSPNQCECLCLFTRGLSRFGLPDLIIDRVTCAYDLAATNTLRGLAVQLLRRLWANPDTPELRLETSTVVEPEDVWGYWSARPLFGMPVPVSLAPATRNDLPEGITHLELLPRPGYPGTRPEWAAHILNQGAGSVAGWQPDTPPYRIDHQPTENSCR